ncbi:MAG: MBL fold metallo-hydrolase [Anaerolineae bacterium]
MTDTPQTYVVPLGVAAALPDAYHANSYLAVVHRDRYWLVDCAEGPIGRLMRVGLNPWDLEGIILTHFHPDHVYGFPALLLGLFLLGRDEEIAPKRSIPIYARPEVLERVRAFVALFNNQNWIETLSLTYHIIEPEVGALVVEDEDVTITAAPTRHSLPSIAVRFAIRGTDRAFVYSSDTAPSPELEALAQNATLLFHEATGEERGHTSAEEAGALAARADVERLVLIHYEDRYADQRLAEARKTFPGLVEMAREFVHYLW